jgi:glycosyltransferase involved in cell wall biosynthesis
MMSTSHTSPIVSVILPTYNRASLLPQAIESVLRQEFTDLELIVIDDGSIDQTPEIISKIEDTRLHYIALKQNRGETFARNQGIQQARGELIAQIDADDIWYPQKASYQVDLFTRFKHLDLIFCNAIDIDHITGIKVDYFKQKAQAFQPLQIRELDCDAWEILAGIPEALLVSNMIVHSTVMLRRSTMESIGVYDENLSGVGDFEYWWRAALRGAKFAYTTRTFLERHRDTQSLTSDKVAAGLRHLRALQVCEQTARETGRNELLPLFQDARYRSWHGIMLEQVRRGKRREAFASYKESIKYERWIYGLTIELLSYLFPVMIGSRRVERIKKWIGPHCLDQIRILRQPIK